MSYDRLVDATAQLVRAVPGAALAAIAAALETLPAASGWPYRLYRVLGAVPEAWVRGHVAAWLHVWETEAPSVAPASLALALRAAALSAEQVQEAQRVELVWTGPSAGTVALRRTDQALLQVIEAARRSLLIVSFAVYRVPNIAAVLVAAAERGVRLRLCLEAPEPSGELIGYDTLRALGSDVIQNAAVYVWPRDQRPTGANQRVAALHAKCAVADEGLLFLSSANLTEYALAMNIELGVLVRGGPLPATVVRQFEDLIEAGILRRVQP